MNEVIQFIDDYLGLFGVPGTGVLLAALVIILTLVLRKFVAARILNYIRKLTKRTKTTLDDALIDILDRPLRLLVLLIGLYIASFVLANYNDKLDQMLSKWLQLGFVIVICWIIYRGADALTVYLEVFTRRTRTELDDLLLPYLKKVIRVAVIILIIMKGAELFLGMSAAALLGLLGGMGLTLGLVFKDIIANWFGCGIIYTDNLFREGDWIQLDDGRLVDADVEEIGLRSTKFRNFDKTVSIVPNGTIANAVVKNWSRMYKRRVKYSFRIDGIAAKKLERVLSGIREILTTDADVHQEFHMVNFRELEGNARIIRLYYFTKTTVWKEHEQIRENVNLKLLALFEQEGIDKLAYTIVDLSDDRPRDFKVKVGEK